jgi:uncharacterized protein
VKKILMLLCGLAVAISPSLAQNAASNNSPPTVTEVMKFFEVMGTRDLLHNVLKAEQEQLKTSSSDMFGKLLPDANPKQREAFQSIMNSEMDDLVKNYPFDDILRDMIPVYQKHLTESDLNTMMAFYSSPVGRKVLKEMPAMTAEAMRVSMVRLQPQMQRMMTDIQSRIQALAAQDKEGDTGKTGNSAVTKKD